jgi:tetratricopeptide (TPR) repeat protein
MKLRGRRRIRELTAVIEQARGLIVEQDDQATFEFLEAAVERFPEDPELRVSLASIYLEFLPDQVRAQAAKAAELGADNASIQVRAGHLLLGGGDSDEARECARRARRTVGSDFVLIAGLEGLEGGIAAADGDDELAEKRLRSAAEREPEYSAYAVDLVQFLARRSRTEEALEAIDKALKTVKERDRLERLRSELAG